MRRYVLRRVGLAALALWALATIVFALVELGGDDPALARMPGDAEPAEIERLREELGLNRPIFVRYFVFLGSGLPGNDGMFGYGRPHVGYGKPYEQPVIWMILERLPYTLAFVVMILGLSAAFATLHNVLLELGKGAWAQAVRIVALVGWSAPPFVASLLLFLLVGSLGMPLAAYDIWRSLLVLGIAVCFQATVLMQLTNRPTVPASGLNWRTAWRCSARAGTAARSTPWSTACCRACSSRGRPPTWRTC